MAQTFVSLIKILNRRIATYLGKEKAYLREISSKLVNYGLIYVNLFKWVSGEIAYLGKTTVGSRRRHVI